MFRTIRPSPPSFSSNLCVEIRYKMDGTHTGNQKIRALFFLFPERVVRVIFDTLEAARFARGLNGDGQNVLLD